MNSLTVHAVGNMLGINLPTSGMARCPFPGHADDTPSFELRRGGLRWICYGCNESGGAIDLVKTYYGVSFLEAKRWLAARIGLEGHRWKQNYRPMKRRSNGSAALGHSGVIAETLPDHALYAALLSRAPLRQNGKEYLQGRSLSDSIIARFKIGQMPSVSMVSALISEFGYARVEAGGILTKQSTRDRYWPVFPEGALLFPYFEAGQTAYLQARVLGGSIQGSRWRNLNHRRRRLYNADVITDARIRSVAICEGAIDVLSAIQLGCQAVGLIGITATLTDAQIVALRGRQVDLLLDWDEPGEKRATTLRRELARFGVAATRKAAPRSGARDVNEYLREGNTRL